ncbi:acetoin utilization AcuB family protein [Geomicrobium sp. JCM 19055]|uniref:acetoin utilization AcuB family protein n=1 Tax=Geomicrobium sp. JCM 19055 TaxID=1460649 RepID=UPI00045ED113|nr:acetoin utilization AcuB family protein [Geomicrobium sp. JCM 19055]GAJ99419.1 CBS domain protein AcuB [Geomicrobium sp. JCM 19055]
MLVEDMMRKPIHTLQETNSIEDAVKMMERERIRHIPIVNQSNELIGIISDRDIRDSKHSIFLREQSDELLSRPLHNIMKRDVFTAHPLDFVEDIASMLSEQQISAAPVTVQKQLVGMITGRDLLDTLVRLTGADQPSSQLEIKVKDFSGTLAEVATIFHKHGVNITSVLVYPHKDGISKVLTFRVQIMDPRPAIQELKEKGYELMSPSVPGLFDE